MLRVLLASVALLVLGSHPALAGAASDFIDDDLLDIVADDQPSFEGELQSETTYDAGLRAGYDSNYDEDVDAVGSPFLEGSFDAEHVLRDATSSKSIEASFEMAALPRLTAPVRADLSVAGGLRTSLGQNTSHYLAARAEIDGSEPPATLKTDWATGLIHTTNAIGAGLRLSISASKDVNEEFAPFEGPIDFEGKLEAAIVLDRKQSVSRYAIASIEGTTVDPEPLLAQLKGGLRGELSESVEFDAAVVAGARIPFHRGETFGASLFPDASLKLKIAEGLRMELSVGGEIYPEDDASGAAMETSAKIALDYASDFGLNLGADLTRTDERSMLWTAVSQEYGLDLTADYVLLKEPEIKITAARSYTWSESSLEIVDRVTLGTSLETSF